MTGLLTVIIGFALAFTWVEVLHLGSKKPFNCLKCMCGWFTLLVGYVYGTPYCGFYLFIGLTVGAIFTAIKYRYL